MKKAVRVLLLSILVLIPPDTFAQRCVQAPGHPHEKLNTLFTARNGSGWTGGDGTYSVALPDGRTLWVFQDSFLGDVEPDGSREPTLLIRNALMVQDGDTLSTLPSEHPGDHLGFLNPQNPEHWYWPFDGTVYNEKLYLFLETYFQESEGGWGFATAGQTDVGVLSLPDLKLEEVVPLPPSQVTYGTAILENGEYVYIYGVEATRLNKYVHVARALADDLLGQWEYFDGDTWIHNPANSARILSGISSQFSVIKRHNRYFLISQADGFGTGIYAYEASRPEGRWENKYLLYCTPETGRDIFTYNAVAHPQFAENVELVISYNVNSFEFQDVFDDVTTYRPRFIQVELPN